MPPESRPFRVALALALLLFAATRLAALDAWPAFIDEAQHLHWAKRIWSAPPFLRPLTDGKALQVALAALVVPFVPDPLLAGRLLSVLAGLVAMASAAGVARELGSRWTAAGASLLYAVLPFAVVHERLALADPFLAAGGGLVLLLTLRLLREPTARDGWRLGLALGGAVLAKVPGLMFFALPLLALAVPRARRRLLVGLLVGGLVAVVPAAYFFTSTAQLDEKIEGPASGVAPQGLLLENLGYAAEWLWTYLTPAPAVLALAGLGLALAGGAAARLTAVAALLPVAAFLGAYHWFPRYVLPCAVPLVALAAWAAERLVLRFPRPRVAALGLAAVALIPALARDVAVVRDPARVLPDVDRFQYVEGWPAGTAGDEAWRTIRAATGGAPALVVVDAAGHSTIHYVLRTRFMNDAATEVLMSDLGDAERTGTLAPQQGRRVFAVATTRRRGEPRPFPPEGRRATLLEELRQGDGTLAGRLYEVLP